MPPDYSPAGLAAAAGADPWALHRRLANGDPGAIRTAAAGFHDAAVAAGEALTSGGDADRTVAAAYANDGAAVFDAPASTARTTVLLADGGEQMEETARALAEVADALLEHTGTAARHLQTLDADVREVVAARNAHLAGATGLGAAELAAAEERYHRMAADATAAAARRIEREIDAYDRVVGNRASRIAEFGEATVRGGGGAGRERGVPGDLTDLGAGAVNGAASLGNALLNDPLAAGGLVVGAAGVVAGGALALAGGTVSVSGAGAVAGIPATGAGLTLAGAAGALVAASAAELGDAAAGVDRVEPLPTDRALSPEEKDAVVRDTVFDEAGNPVGDPGSRAAIREVGAEQFKEIEDSVRNQLGSPDRVIDIPGKGRVEVWEIAPDRTVTYRDFSRSGSLGASGAETIDLRGFDGIDRIHYQEE